MLHFSVFCVDDDVVVRIDDSAFAAFVTQKNDTNAGRNGNKIEILYVTRHKEFLFHLFHTFTMAYKNKKRKKNNENYPGSFHNFCGLFHYVLNILRFFFTSFLVARLYLYFCVYGSCV